MRIVGGTLKGRTLHEPHKKGTHPMSEKVRGALFNILGDIEGLTILDAFAGSGALAFEAVSRGAEDIVAIEKDKAVHDVIEKSARELKLPDGKISAVRANAAGWSIHNMERTFDIVILAPPYGHLQESLLAMLGKRHTKKGGLVVLDWPGKREAPEFEDTKIVEQKKYGDAQLVFYRKMK